MQCEMGHFVQCFKTKKYKESFYTVNDYKTYNNRDIII